MGSIYGDILLHFPEQMVTVSYFQMIPKINSGFEMPVDEDDEEILPVDIQVIFQTTPNTVTDSNGNLVVIKGLSVWSMEVLNLGWFIKEGSDIYAIKTENNWKREGGYYSYSIEKTIGDDGTAEDVEFESPEGDFK